MDLSTSNKVVSKEDVIQGLDEVLDFQNKEKWRGGNWQVDSTTLVNLEGFEKSTGNWDKSEVSRSDALLAMSKGMVNRKYLLIQQYSNEMDYSGQIPVTVGVVSGKDIKSLLTTDNLSNSYVYGPSLAIENDAGYDAGTQYLLDVTDLKSNVKALLQASREALDDMQEKAYRYLESGNDNESSYEQDSYYGDRRYEGYDRAFNKLYDDEDEYSRRNDTSSEAYQSFIDKAVRSVVKVAYDNEAKSPFVALQQEFAKAVNYDLAKYLEEKRAKQLKEAQKAIEPKKVATKEQTKLETPAKSAVKTTPSKTTTVQKATYKKVEPKKQEVKATAKTSVVAKPVKETTAVKEQPKVAPVKVIPTQTKNTPEKKSFTQGKTNNNNADEKGVVIFIKPGIAKAIREKGPNGKPLTKEFTIEGYNDDRIKNGIIRFSVNDTKNNVTAKQLYTSPKFRNWTVVNGQENSTVTVSYQTKMNHSTVVREESLDIYKFQAWVKERNKEQVKTATKSGVADGNSGRGE